jgi:hypothetical protein
MWGPRRAEGDRACAHRSAVGKLAVGRVAVFCAGAAIILALGQTSVAQAADRVDATSERAALDEAVRTIPWSKLTGQERHRVEGVVKNVSIYRRLPVRVIDCDPEVFTFLVRNPEVVVDVWRVMGVSRVTLDRVSDGVYRGTDGAGTEGGVRFMHAEWGPNAKNVAVVYADGAYEGKPMVSAVKAESVLLLQSEAVRETNGRHYITVKVDSFIHIERADVELLAKTIRPWITRTTDQNFIETLTFVSTFSRTAEQNPQGMQRLADRLTTVDGRTRNELVRICYQTAGRQAQREKPTRTGSTPVARRTELASVPVR